MSDPEPRNRRAETEQKAAFSIAEARRQSRLIAADQAGEDEIMLWIDAVSDRDGWR
jgi:hypothetical protein